MNEICDSSMTAEREMKISQLMEIVAKLESGGAQETEATEREDFEKLRQHCEELESYASNLETKNEMLERAATNQSE